MTTTSAHRAPLALAGFAAAVAVVAMAGALASTNARGVYGSLNLPSWAPPPWLFGPVWTVLYGMIAVSGWLYWRAGGDRRGLTVYAAGLLLNLAWTPLFFAAGAYELALADIVLLDLAVVAAIVLFHRRSPVAAWLQVPYLLWILYASALTGAIVALN
ncbi:TspO/MBR family protein [Amycolatopsis albispora]|uniref:Peripheral-type benzodiazepine receptor n=1 Tax=Amycolatopsis albispora TaxID=1804986 RepID=A0A344L2B2_9PSEU|nr:TspO/MBR family protein [Amycolatopsis albispora]AXB42186.1 peripheral-type benzodiazepine receptor [Amycolatopsis albispora]